MSAIDHNRAGQPSRPAARRDATRPNYAGYGRRAGALARFERQGVGRGEGQPPR